LREPVVAKQLALLVKNDAPVPSDRRQAVAFGPRKSAGMLLHKAGGQLSRDERRQRFNRNRYGDRRRERGLENALSFRFAGFGYTNEVIRRI
jgi:hypothetical protein